MAAWVRSPPRSKKGNPMNISEISGDNYSVKYSKENMSIIFDGALREYEHESLNAVLDEAKEIEGSLIILDFTKLTFADSSAINSFGKFVISCRNNKKPKIIMKGNRNAFWQKNLYNYKKISPEIEIVW